MQSNHHHIVHQSTSTRAARQRGIPLRPDVLVVDHDASIATFLHELLEEEGYRVRIARDGRQALAALALHRPALLLLDSHLPDLPLPILVERIIERGFGNVPLIMTTAASQLDVIQTASRSNHVLAKPFDLDKLLHTIATSCRPYQQQPRPMGMLAHTVP